MFLNFDFLSQQPQSLVGAPEHSMAIEAHVPLHRLVLAVSGFGFCMGVPLWLEQAASATSCHHCWLVQCH